MTIDDYIKWANKEIDKNESYIQAADSLPGLYYDAEEVKGYEKNIEHYKQLVEYLKGCKKGYVHIDDVYRLIAGHSNYHGDSILSALTCVAEGKNVTKSIIPLDKEDCSFEKMPPVAPKEKTGKWIEDANKIDAKFGRHTYICSECGKYAEYFVSGTEVWWDRIKPNFCPNCGAKMEVENADSN